MPKDWHKLPDMGKWDGVPSVDFRTGWYRRLMVSLSSVVQDGYTLLDCAKRLDHGADEIVRAAVAAQAAVPAVPAAPGVPAVPAQPAVAAVAAVTEEDVRKTQLRKRRLHACMVNLIDANSQLYQVVTKTPFTNSGPSTYEYLWVAGHLERDRDETQRLHNEWSEASLHSCKIRINAQALYKYRPDRHRMCARSSFGRNLIAP